ncbi:MAG: TraB/GumN family protein [Oscillospiraceae bacterium]|nr:TraB/GumN family protein [Oscillospiraceae bacterium]
MKKVSVFLVLVLLLSLFAGCRQEPASTTAAAETTKAAAPVTTEAGTAAPVTTEAAVTTEAPTQTPAETYAPEELAAVRPMLFHVTGEKGREMYLFGTIHVADRRVDAALAKLAPILDGCDALGVEFDLVAYEQDLEAQMKSMSQFLYTDGSTVEDHMPQELYQRAAKLLQEAGVSPMGARIFKLSMWSTLVEQAALMTRTDFDMNVGMDRSLIHYCYDHKIPVRDVESPELQYDMMAGFSDELSLLMIESTLDSLEDYGEGLNKLYDAWLAGNYDNLLAVLNEESEDDEELTPEQKALVEDYNDQMLTQRNLGMRDRALEWMEAGDKVFFAVGAAHLMDEDGLVALLRAEGYTVEQIEY